MSTQILLLEKRCAQADDLLCQMSKLQETVKKLHIIRGTEVEINLLFQNYVHLTDITVKEAPWRPTKARLCHSFHPPASQLKTEMKF